MPCISGRSSHVLCKPGCEDANKCCASATEAFSVRPYCFCTEDQNVPNNALVSVTDVRRMFCAFFSSSQATFDAFTTSTTYAVAADAICGLTGGLSAISFDCPVDVNVQLGTGTVVTLATLNRGACVSRNDADTVFTAGEWKLLVDSLECTTFTVA